MFTQSPAPVELVRLSPDEFAELVRLGKRAELLAVADSGDTQKILAYLAELGIREEGKVSNDR